MLFFYRWYRSYNKRKVQREKSREGFSSLLFDLSSFIFIFCNASNNLGSILALGVENQKFMEMKKFYTLFSTLLATVIVGNIYAVQRSQVEDTQQIQADTPMPQKDLSMPQADTTLLSEWVDGAYLVRRYRVVGREPAHYTLKYAVSADKLNTLLAGNEAEIEALDKMMADIRQDSAMRVQSIDITGFASPDGNAMRNEALALERAQKFRSLLESRYAVMGDYVVRVMADAEQWDNCNEAVLASVIADKQRVLTILDSPATEAAKEQSLKQMPEVWNVFREQILPPMRRVEMVVNYDKDMVVEVRTLIDKPQPQPRRVEQRKGCKCGDVVVDETIGIIIDLTDPEGIY